MALTSGTTTISASMSTGTITINETGVVWIFTNDSTLTVNGPIIVSNSGSLSIKGYGQIARGNAARELFNVYGGGTLIIEGNSATERIVIDGKNKSTAGSLIRQDGTLSLEYVTLQNNKTSIVRDYTEKATDDTDDNFAGGAITVCDIENRIISIDNCIFKDNSAASGGGIYITRMAKGIINIVDTDFINCQATKSNHTSGGYGGGGAILMDGRASVGETGKVYLENMTVTISGGKIENCTSVGCGSAVYMNEGGHAIVNINGTLIQGCLSNGASCGTIRCDGNGSYKLTIDNCTIQNNESTDGHGGGIYWNALGDGASLTVQNSNILNNTVSQYGGGMFVEGSKISVINTIIRGNHAVYGGGIGIKTFADGAFKNNSAIAGTSFNLELGDDVIIEENEATTYGGGVSYLIVAGVPASGFVFNYTNNGAIIRNNIVSDETGKGGGIAIVNSVDKNNSTFPNRVYSANVFMQKGSMHGNSAPNGGCIYMNMGNFEMSGGKIYNHIVSGNGGAAYIEDGDFIFSGGEIGSSTAEKTGNSANLGGGVYVVGGDFTMSGGVMSGNNAGTYGGGAYITGGDFSMTSGVLNGNSATSDGGGVYVDGGAVVIGAENYGDYVDPVLTGNSAVNGGAIYVNNQTPIMYYGEMNNNIASANGGAVYVTNGGFDIKTGSLNGNEALNGGAVYLTDGAFEMQGGSLLNNAASNDGGAVYIASGDISILSGNITSNACTYNGGAFYVADGNVSIGVEGCLYEPDNNYHTVSGYTEMTHPIIQYNNANRGGSIYLSSANGLVQHYCGTMTDNYAYDTGRNIYLENGTFNYYAGQIGTNFDTGIEIENGVFEDLSEEAQEKIVKELIYHSSLVPYTEDDEVIVNAGIPDTKWINAPNAVDLLLEDVDPDSPTWGELFPEYTFVNWYSEENDQSIDLYADWVGSSMNLFKIQQRQNSVLESYKNSVNWSEYADQIVAIT